MLAELAVILIILVTASFSYFKGNVIKAFLLLINALIAATIAFAYFETLARIIIGYEYFVQWATALSLVLIFAVVLTILNAISDKLIPADIYFGDSADKIIRSLISVFAGLSIAGIILTATAETPIGTQWPYERFSPSIARFTVPDKQLILDADGFITTAASWFSRGSMSGQKSFAVFHPDFVDEIYLNRIGTDRSNPLAATESSVSVESATAVQTELVSASDNQPISEGSGRTKAVIVKTTSGGVFTLSQVRLVCKNSDSADNLTGSAEVVWPIGYITRDNIVNRLDISQKLTPKQFDFVFYIPADTVPIMLQYKQNVVVPIGRLIIPDFSPIKRCKRYYTL
jgi:hypothetical protein